MRPFASRKTLIAEAEKYRAAWIAALDEMKEIGYVSRYDARDGESGPRWIK